MNPQDDEPVVIVDDAELDALPAVGDLSAATQAYLRSQGVTDAATWAAFRLDQVGDAAHRLLPPSSNRRPSKTGLWLPTCDPRSPETITGLIRMTPAQNLHRFLSAPSGLAAAVDLDQRNRVVLADNPLLTLKLYQAGVADVALVQDPAVLAPLQEWLATRAVVLLSTKATGLEALRAGLGSIVPVQSKLIMAGRLSADVRELLGAAPAVVDPALPITPHLLHELVTYAHSRLDAGEAAATLTEFGAAIPDLVKAYRIGFLPPNYRSSLSSAARQMLIGHRCGRSLVLPALDAAGQVVDLCIVRGDPASPHVDGLWPEPRGMLAPELITGHTTISVTDCLAWLIRLFGEGYRDVLFMRGLADANASRIAAAGITTVVVRCYRQASEYAAIFQAAGLRVTMDQAEAERSGSIEVPEHPVNADALTFVEADEQVAIYQAGPVRYAITVRDDGKTIRKVVIRAHGKSCQHDLDLAVHAQRERTAKNAAQQVGLAPSVISAHLVGLLALVQEREDARDRGPCVPLADEDQAAADGFLGSPDLLSLVADDLTAMGWIGETRTKHLLYLTAISRLLPHPVWAVYQAGAGAAPWAGVDAIAALTPLEDKATFHRLTSAAVKQADHRLLVIDQAENLRPDAALALRVMQERGTVAVLAAAAGPLDPRCRDGFLSVTVDESPEQTERILAEQRHRLGVLSIPATVIQARHHAAQRLLERLPVVIPFADRIVFPANRVRHRDEQRWFLHLIAASALLHQRQRRRDGGAVVASELDFSIVVNCTAGLIGCEAGGLGIHARRLLGELALREAKSFSIADLAKVLPEWTRWMFRAALQDLMDFGYLDSPRAGRGKLRLFRIGSRSSRVGAISLRPVGEPAPAPEVGGWRKLAEPDSANCIPVRTGT